MRVILIGNYRLDQQQSMLRFAQMMQEGLSQAGISSTIWYPTVLFGRAVGNTTSGLGKWIGYVDKWLVFPIILWCRMQQLALNRTDYRVHICDHSNAPYLKWLPRQRTIITCHDVLAIQGAIGVEHINISSSRTGKIYQNWILKNLIAAPKIATVSHFTLKHLQTLAGNAIPSDQDWRVIHNAFNADFAPLDADRANALLAPYGLSTHTPFILHVGSALPRKNRRMLLDMAATLGDRWKGYVCLAGQPLDEPLLRLATELGLTNRLISVVNPDHVTLLALYSACQAFIFPSFSEGFGWPVIEAQACGAPVIASHVEPMPEVSGGAALLADPAQPKTFSDALLALQEATIRQDLIKQGFVNCSRFNKQTMIDAYLTLYNA